MAKKIQMCCSTCGSNDVRRDADAVWNSLTQEWELNAVFDNATCEACGGETHIREVDLKKQKKPVVKQAIRYDLFHLS